VRSHVMQESRRKQSDAKRKRRQDIANTALVAPSTNLQDCTQCSRRRNPRAAFLIISQVAKALKPERKITREGTLGPCILPHSSALHTFERRPPTDDRPQLHNAMTISKTQTVSRRPLWFTKAVVDPAMLCPTFLLASHQSNTLNDGIQENKILVSSRADAIRKIRTNICESALTSSSDLFTTITTLALHEVSLSPS
jgi:hypothetical protein